MEKGAVCRKYLYGFLLLIFSYSASAQLKYHVAKADFLKEYKKANFVQGYYTGILCAEQTSDIAPLLLKYDSLSLKIKVFSGAVVSFESDTPQVLLIVRSLREKNYFVLENDTIRIHASVPPYPILISKLDSSKTVLSIELSPPNTFFRKYSNLSSLDASHFKVKRIVLTYSSHGESKSKEIVFDSPSKSQLKLKINLLNEIPNWNDSFKIVSVQVKEAWRLDRFLDWNLELYESLFTKF